MDSSSSHTTSTSISLHPYKPQPRIIRISHPSQPPEPPAHKRTLSYSQVDYKPTHTTTMHLKDKDDLTTHTASQPAHLEKIDLLNSRIESL